MRIPDIQLPESDRAKLISDLVVFLIKSGLEAVMDIMVMPFALAAGLLDFLAGPKHNRKFFYRMMAAFRDLDERIDQFGPIEDPLGAVKKWQQKE